MAALLLGMLNNFDGKFIVSVLTADDSGPLVVASTSDAPGVISGASCYATLSSMFNFLFYDNLIIVTIL